MTKKSYNSPLGFLCNSKRVVIIWKERAFEISKIDLGFFYLFIYFIYYYYFLITEAPSINKPFEFSMGGPKP